jgi:predicted ATPase/class 3 adenylate cyclase
MGELPIGTVTLLFTDIEGSTRLLTQLGNRYAEVLEACRSLLRGAFQEWDGHEVDTQGDAFFIAFARASDAVAAAVEAQHALANHPWPEGTTVRVRMGLHTGEPLRSTEGYVGLDVHHAARIMSAGHGGQVLLSQTTCELVEQNLPDGVSLRDLGEQRLKDLQRPGRVYQLVIAGLPADFPPPKSLDNSPNNLPLQLTPLIGREHEVAKALNFLQREEARLLTLTGPGGTGKTRLALQIAAELSEAFSDGVYFVNLAPLSDPAFVIPTIVQTLDIKEIADHTLLDLLKASLHWKQLLLLLDNFEQVIDAAKSVAELLAACPLLKVLVTSRAALHVRGEQEFAVSPLAVPDPKHLPDLVTLSQYEAIALFITRAQAVKPEFQLTNSNAPAVAEICVRLDGLPLAIELAAARIKVLPPQALLVRLDQQLAVLTSGVRDAPARQQTLRNTLEWSHQLLDTDEQRLFRRLSVFVGGCTLEAIEEVCATLDIDTETGQVLERVASLIDKSLLQQTEMEGENPRFVMLETIREYGLEVLVASKELAATRHAHAMYYLALAEKAELEFDSPQQEAVWLERLEREHDNLRAALQWLLELRNAEPSREKALRLGAALQRFWYVRGYFSEGRSFLERALTGSEGVATPVRAKALRTAANLAFGQGDNVQGKLLCEDSLVLYRESGDKKGAAYCISLMSELAWIRSDYVMARSLIEESLVFWKEVDKMDAIAWALTSLADVVSEQGEYTRGRTLYEQSLVMQREIGNKRGVAWSLYGLAQVLFFTQHDLATIHSLLEESLTLFRELSQKEGIIWAPGLLGQVFLQQGEDATARSLLEESVVMSREIGIQWSTAQSLPVLARAAARVGDYTAAHDLYDESLAITRKVGNKWLIASCLEGLAVVVAKQGDLPWAARLWCAAEMLRDVIGGPLPPVYHADYEQAVAAARAQLGEKVFATAWAEGRTMTPDQALAAQGTTLDSSSSSMGERISAPPATSTVTYPDGLTAREVEVLRCAGIARCPDR